MRTEYLILSDFSVEVYKQHKDLAGFSDGALIEHFLQFGIQEGRIYNHIINREGFLKLVDQRGNMLEIGPLDWPQLNKESPTYHSLDVFTRSELQEFYKDDPSVRIDNIVEPTYVISENDYSPIDKKFKCIFSSHSIEHMPCLVTFLQNLQGLLEDNGYIYFIIPDKRYCFDYYKNESDIYDVLQLYYEKNYRPRLADVLRMRTLGAHNNSVDHWLGKHGENDYKVRLTGQYENILAEYKTGKYMDSHVSFFTPDSFLTIMAHLKEMGLVGLEPKKLYHTVQGSNEFYVIVGKV